MPNAIINNSVSIGSIDNGFNRGELDFHMTELLRHANGNFFTIEIGGPRTHVNRKPKWTERDAAIKFMRSVQDAVSGYHYSDEQIAILMDQPIDSSDFWEWSQQHDLRGQTER